MNESLKDLKPELESLSGKLELEVSNFLNHLSFTSDPIAAITGEKGRWLILNPFVKTKPLLDKIINHVSGELYRKSEGQFYLINASLDSSGRDLTLGIGSENNEPFIFWSLFGRGITAQWQRNKERKTDLKICDLNIREIQTDFQPQEG